MTDCFGYTIAQTSVDTDDEYEKYREELWHYYNVESPVWDLDGAMTNLVKVNGNYVADPDMNPDDAEISVKARFESPNSSEPAITLHDNNSIIRFKNDSGVKIETPVKIFIPVTVTHKWGEVTEWVTIPVNPNPKAQ